MGDKGKTVIVKFTSDEIRMIQSFVATSLAILCIDFYLVWGLMKAISNRDHQTIDNYLTIFVILWVVGWIMLGYSARKNKIKRAATSLIVSFIIDAMVFAGFVFYLSGFHNL